MHYSVRDAAGLTRISESTLRLYMKKFPGLFESSGGRYKRIMLTEREIEIFLKIRTLSKQNISAEEIESIIRSNSEHIVVNKVDEKNVQPARDSEPALMGLMSAVTDLKDELYRQNSVLERFEKITGDLDTRNRELLEQNRMLMQKIEELNRPQEPKKPVSMFELMIERFMQWLHE